MQYESTLGRGLKVLILHAHWNNRGDEAAIRAMIDSLRAEIPIEKMWIMYMAPNFTGFPYHDISVLEPFPNIWQRRNIAERLDVWITLASFARIALTSRGRAFLAALREADIVLHAPGGPNLGDNFRMFELQYLYRLMTAIMRRKTIFFYAPSMGPFSGRLKNVLRKFILRHAQPLVVREHISSLYLLEQLGLNSITALDSAFQNQIPPDCIKGYEGNIGPTMRCIEANKTVGIVVTDLRWHQNYRHRKGLDDTIFGCFSHVVDTLLENGYRIILIPQLFAVHQDHQPFLRLLRDGGKDQLMVCPPEVDAYAQQIVISKLHSVISMRYHPLVFAIKMNVPCISIYYEHKARALMELAGLARFALPVEDLNADSILAMFREIEKEHSSIKQRLESINASLRRESMKTTAILVQQVIQTREPSTGVAQTAH